MLSSHERRVWTEIEQSWTADVPEAPPPRLHPPHWYQPGSHPADDLPWILAAGIWAAIVLTLVGLVVAGLTVGLVTAVGWLLWRLWRLGGRDDALPSEAAGDPEDRRPAAR